MDLHRLGNGEDLGGFGRRKSIIKIYRIKTIFNKKMKRNINLSS